MTISEYNEKAQNFQFKYRTTNPLAIAKTESEKLEFIAQLEKDLIRLQYDYLFAPYQDINAEGYFLSAHKNISKAKSIRTNDIRHQLKAISNAVKATMFSENNLTKTFDYIVKLNRLLIMWYDDWIENQKPKKESVIDFFWFTEDFTYDELIFFDGIINNDELKTSETKYIPHIMRHNAIDIITSEIESMESVINEDFRIPLLVGQLRQLKEKIENEEEENKIEYSFVKILVLARKIEDSLKRRIQE